jgi:fumarate reductase (CoM/CoB) subunit B
MTLEDPLRTLKDADETCVRCELCTGACEVLGRDGLAIGEVASQALSKDPSCAAVLAVARCALCGYCCVACPVGIDSFEVMTAAREAIVEAQGPSVLDYEYLFSGCEFSTFKKYKEANAISYADLAREHCDAIFFPGCAMSAYSPELVRAIHKWLESGGETVGVVDECCGAPMLLGGLHQRAEEARSRIAAQVATTGAKRLIALCPDCFAELSGRMGEAEVVALSSVLCEAGARFASPELLTVHDSCPDRANLVFARDVREILSDCKMTEMEHYAANAICCGSGGLVSCVDPDCCEERSLARVQEFWATGADRMVTACVNCAHRLGLVAGPSQVVHYLELIFGVWIDWDDISQKYALLFADEGEDESEMRELQDD